MLRNFTIALTLMMLMLTVGISQAVAQEMVDNPVYQDWARFKVGTTVSYEQKMKAQGQDMAMKQTFKLTALDKEKADVQLTQSMNMGGMAMEMPGMTLTHPAKVKKEELDKADQPGEMPRIKVEGGREKVDAAGKTFDCTWGEVEMEQDGAKMKGKTWVSTEVPGGMVKMNVKGTVEGEPVEMHSKLVELKIEK